MVHALARSLVRLLKPLLVKSLRLLAFACGAVSLSAVNTVKSVPILAHGLCFVYCSKRQRVLHRVLKLGDQTEMLWINAMSVLADVIYNHFFRYVAKLPVIRHAVCLTIFLFEIKLPVSIFIEIPTPQSTISLVNDKLIKPVEFFLCKSNHIAQYIPCSSICTYV